MKRLEVSGNRLVTEQDGAVVSLDAGQDPLGALPHVARGMFDEAEREAFGLLSDFAQELTGSPACAAVIVRTK